MQLNVVVPVYGCRDCLAQLHQRLAAALQEITPRYQLIFVDDRSTDGAWAVLENLARSDPHVKAVRLSRNFGQHAAITAGLVASDGDWTVVMDCDLQDPPEAIGRLVAKANEGFDLVLARRNLRTSSRIRLMLSSLYFRVLNQFMGTHLDGRFGTFSLLSRKVVDAYLLLGERDRHYMFVLDWLGFERGTVDIEQDARAAGESSYKLRRLVSHAVSGIFFQTTILLVYIVYLGFAVAAAGIVLAAFLVYLDLVAHPQPGWVSVMVLILVIGGVIITSTGVTGLYIGRVFQQVKGRPLYVIDTMTRKADTPQVVKPKAAGREVGSIR